MSGAGGSGIVSPVEIVPVTAPSHGMFRPSRTIVPAAWSTQNRPNMLSKEWFSWNRITTWRMGVGSAGTLAADPRRAVATTTARMAPQAVSEPSARFLLMEGS
jgi:hypothetical protein